MKAVYSAGRANDSIECEDVSEGESGLYLQDASGNNIGYIPYDSLLRVEPTDER